MRKLTLSAEALVAAVILNVLAFVLGPAHLAWTATIAGIAILLVLLAFDLGQTRSFWQSMAYGATCGFVLATAALFPLTEYVPWFTRPFEVLSGHPVLPVIWLAGTIAFATADRVRNNSTPITVRVSAAPANAPVQRTIAKPFTAMPAVVLPGVAAPAAAEPVESMPVISEPAMAPQDLAEAPPTAAAPIAAVPEVPVAQALPAGPPPGTVEVKAQPAPKGKPATIYLNLVGTGIACLRPVKAEHLGRGFYRIVEPVPTDEEWQFQTGQIVRCRKQSLSSGKGLVAFEEAPRVS